MQSIKEILEAKNKVAYKTVVRKTITPTPQAYHILKNKVDNYPDDVTLLLEQADPKQVDSHNPEIAYVNLDGFRYEKINTARYLIQMVIHFKGEVMNRAYIVGMFNFYSKCYKRELTVVNAPTDKVEDKKYQNAKEIFK